MISGRVSHRERRWGEAPRPEAEVLPWATSGRHALCDAGRVPSGPEPRRTAPRRTPGLSRSRARRVIAPSVSARSSARSASTMAACSAARRWLLREKSSAMGAAGPKATDVSVATQSVTFPPALSAPSSDAFIRTFVDWQEPGLLAGWSEQQPPWLVHVWHAWAERALPKSRWDQSPAVHDLDAVLRPYTARTRVSPRNRDLPQLGGTSDARSKRTV